MAGSINHLVAAQQPSSDELAERVEALQPVQQLKHERAQRPRAAVGDVGAGVAAQDSSPTTSRQASVTSSTSSSSLPPASASMTRSSPAALASHASSSSSTSPRAVNARHRRSSSSSPAPSAAPPRSALLLHEIHAPSSSGTGSRASLSASVGGGTGSAGGRRRLSPHQILLLTPFGEPLPSSVVSESVSTASTASAPLARAGKKPLVGGVAVANDDVLEDAATASMRRSSAPGPSASPFHRLSPRWKAPVRPGLGVMTGAGSIRLQQSPPLTGSTSLPRGQSASTSPPSPSTTGLAIAVAVPMPIPLARSTSMPTLTPREVEAEWQKDDELGITRADQGFAWIQEEGEDREVGVELEDDDTFSPPAVENLITPFTFLDPFQGGSVAIAAEAANVNESFRRPSTDLAPFDHRYDTGYPAAYYHNSRRASVATGLILTGMEPIAASSPVFSPVIASTLAPSTAAVVRPSLLRYRTAPEVPMSVSVAPSEQSPTSPEWGREPLAPLGGHTRKGSKASTASPTPSSPDRNKRASISWSRINPFAATNAPSGDDAAEPTSSGAMWQAMAMRRESTSSAASSTAALVFVDATSGSRRPSSVKMRRSMARFTGLFTGAGSKRSSSSTTSSSEAATAGPSAAAHAGATSASSLNLAARRGSWARVTVVDPVMIESLDRPKPPAAEEPIPMVFAGRRRSSLAPAESSPALQPATLPHGRSRASMDIVRDRVGSFEIPTRLRERVGERAGSLPNVAAQVAPSAMHNASFRFGSLSAASRAEDAAVPLMNNPVNWGWLRRGSVDMLLYNRSDTMARKQSIPESVGAGSLTGGGGGASLSWQDRRGSWAEH